MDEILETLSHTSGIAASMIVGKDGLVISQAGRLDDIDTDLLGATASEIYQSAESMMGEKFNRGALEGLMVEANGGKFMINSINDEVFLLVMCKKKLNLGLARWEVSSAAGKLKEEI
jgi:predicted regulator of Ras-like GTPase activity (Roadblock/LC7/MglB family)